VISILSQHLKSIPNYNQITLSILLFNSNYLYKSMYPDIRGFLLIIKSIRNINTKNTFSADVITNYLLINLSFLFLGLILINNFL